MFKEKVYPLFEKWKNTGYPGRYFSTKTVYGYFPCQRDETSGHFEQDLKKERLRFRFPQQKNRSNALRLFPSLGSSGLDVIALMLVTSAPSGPPKLRKSMKPPYTDYLYLHASRGNSEPCRNIAQRIRQELKMDVG